ncbi:MAG: lytic transglycosylase domain-containing protein [Thalassovita sp.]
MALKLVFASLVGAVLCAGSALADKPAPFPEFTFKRVKPPQPGQKKRINVQIDPTAQTVQEAPVVQNSPDSNTDGQGAYGWFWEEVSPALTDSGPGRLELALTALSKAPAGQAVPSPRLDELLPIVRQRAAEMLLNTIDSGVSPALVLAVISVESGGKADAVSGAGAEGLMQLIPATAERFGVSDSLDADDNIKGGVAYLSWLLSEFNGDPVLALAAYNAGENAVRTHEGVPPYDETRNYVPKVLAAYAVAKNLCLTPPVLISDGCVFQLGG